MKPIEEFRYLVLATQREGNRILVEATLYEFIVEALEGQSLSESIAVLWRLIEG